MRSAQLSVPQRRKVARVQVGGRKQSGYGAPSGKPRGRVAAGGRQVKTKAGGVWEDGVTIPSKDLARRRPKCIFLKVN